MYEMRRRKLEPTPAGFYWLKGSLTSHTIKRWYERNWLLMMLQVIHSGEMDCSTANCYSSDRDLYPCLQDHIPCALTIWAISPPCICMHCIIDVFISTRGINIICANITKNAVGSWLCGEFNVSCLLEQPGEPVTYYLPSRTTAPALQAAGHGTVSWVIILHTKNRLFVSCCFTS